MAFATPRRVDHPRGLFQQTASSPEATGFVHRRHYRPRSISQSRRGPGRAEVLLERCTDKACPAHRRDRTATACRRGARTPRAFPCRSSIGSCRSFCLQVLSDLAGRGAYLSTASVSCCGVTFKMQTSCEPRPDRSRRCVDCRDFHAHDRQPWRITSIGTIAAPNRQFPRGVSSRQRQTLAA